MTKSDEYIDIEVVFKRASPKAALLAANDEEFWCPFSCMHVASERLIEEARFGEELTLKIREWKLEEAGVL